LPGVYGSLLPQWYRQLIFETDDDLLSGELFFGCLAKSGKEGLDRVARESGAERIEDRV
jgi:hypothetical protein